MCASAAAYEGLSERRAAWYPPRWPMNAKRHAAPCARVHTLHHASLLSLYLSTHIITRACLFDWWCKAFPGRQLSLLF